jgi:hypothetical protein
LLPTVGWEQELSCSRHVLVFDKSLVSYWDPAKRQRAAGKSAAVILMLLLWLGTLALSFSPELHHLFHKDAASSSHNCVVTQLSSGSVVAGFVSVTVPLPPLDCVEISVAVVSPRLSLLNYRLSPSRAPPIAS